MNRLKTKTLYNKQQTKIEKITAIKINFSQWNFGSFSASSLCDCAPPLQPVLR